MIQLNLLPDVKKEYLAAQRTRNLVISGSIIAMIAAAGAIVALAVFTYGAQAGLGLIVDNEIKSRSDELSKKEDLGSYLTIQNQLAVLPGLHDGKPIYSRFLDFLPKLNPAAPNNVKLSKVIVDNETKTISMEGSGSNFAAVTTFQSTLQNAELSIGGGQPSKLFSDVAMAQPSLGENSDNQKVVSFKATVTFDEAVFLSSSKNVVVSVPTLNTTDSAQSSPRGLFGDNPGGQE